MRFRSPETLVLGRWAAVELFKEMMGWMGWHFSLEEVKCTLCGSNRDCDHRADRWYIASRPIGLHPTRTSSVLQSVSVLLINRNDKWWPIIGQWFEHLPELENGEPQCDLISECRFYYREDGYFKGVWAGIDAVEGPHEKSFGSSPEEEHAAKQAVIEAKKAARLTEHPELEWRIDDWKQVRFSVRVEHLLRYEGIATIGELIERTAKELMAIRNFGPAKLDEVKKKLESFGLSLKEESKVD